MKRNASRTLLVCAALGACVSLIDGAAGIALAAKPTSSEIRVQLDATALRDADGDIARSDGGGAYLTGDGEVRSYIRDFTPSVPDDENSTATQDRLYFRTQLGGARKMTFDNVWASGAEFGPGSSQPIQCGWGYILFESTSTPDWFERLAAVGESVRGWAIVGCHITDTFRYHAYYDHSPSASGAGECLRLTRTDETTLTLTAVEDRLVSPLGHRPCNASIQTYDYNTGGDSLGVSSAPLEATFQLPSRQRGRGNRR